MSGADPATARRLLATPVGLPGSGRLRYGGAMALHAAGEMSFAALEVYRLVAMLDSEDPVPILRARRLRLQPPPPEDPVAELSDLAEALDLRLAALRAPGAAELRQAFAAARRARLPGPWRMPDPPAVVGHLAPAVAALAPADPVLAQALLAAAPHLGWQPRKDGCGAAFAPLLGPGAPWPCDTAELGLSLAAPGAIRPCAARREPAWMILPLTGPHGWRAGPGRPVLPVPALVPLVPRPGPEPVLQAGPLPFLALAGRALSPPARSG